jgi:uncharacterized membrane protein
MRTNRWLIGGLVVSLVANLLLVGFVAGRMSGFAPPPGFGPDPTVGFFRMLGFLSEERRATIAPDLRKQMHQIVPVLRKIRGDQRDVFEALTADPFDAAALEAALADLRANLTATQIASHAAFVEMVRALTPDEREALARAMRRPSRHRMGDSERGERAPLGMHPGRSRSEPPQEDR